MTTKPAVVSMIVAMAQNGVIGRDNGLPWRLPADLKRFKALTMGKPILMGRRTFDSIGKPLPGRKNIVLTRDRGWKAPGTPVASHAAAPASQAPAEIIVVHSLAEAFDRAHGAPELVAIGGAEIYNLLMPFTDRIYLTHVHADVQGDTVFPQIALSQWADVECIPHPADERHAYAMTFMTLQRKVDPPAEMSR